ncbi:MAG: NmrA family NAD(P)-binding protein [Phaeodactylibacter xiamenensis]|uniref:NmrA family transcriptional regulator n=1 Tax=Phaeodactylibacter xiamenensis TaxID=1524460 RepID=A0A098S9L8_9BACT|nr:NmrA family NAD(P)-binding protein [Phaeodactylibacter xiamenensis]KGE89284.1 NmrA family transcriptional regulator [Phaeodactylibacter xiamenensis]MCR9054725.1 NAD(P)H-binding protein [bacterium]
MKNSSNILVIGGTGKTGRKVAQELQKRGQKVRIGGRNSNPAFDWSKPDTWAEALEGMDKVYIVFYPDLAVPGALQAITKLTEMAKEAGVQKAVLLSGKGEQEAERCEQVVAQSGMDYTLVRASWFSQNFSESFLMEPILAGYVALPMPDAKIPFVDTGDIAEVVVEALINDAHNGQTYELTGPRAITFRAAVREIEAATGKSIVYRAVSLEDYKASMEAAGLPDDYVWLIDYLFREVLSVPANQDVTRDVERVLGRPATDFTAYAQKTAASGIWGETVPQSV